MKEIDVLPKFIPGQITIQPIPMYQYQGNVASEMAQGRLDQNALVRILDVMLMNRYFEEIIVEMKQGKFVPYQNFNFIGATHLSVGQEAVAVGVMSAIRGRDYITSTHRGHGHSIAKGAYRIYGMTRAEQLAFLPASPTLDGLSAEELQQRTLEHHLYKTMCELLGKEDGYCHGRGGGMHIADFNAGHLGANAIVGGSYAIGAGAALAQHLLNTNDIVACLVGDGATNNGIAHEAMNFAVQCQFGKGLPVIFVIENNQYGMTGQQCQEVTGVQYLAQRGAGYRADNIHAEVVNGMHVLAVHDAVRRAAEKCRAGEGPVLLECMTYRYYGHSLSDKRTSYRTTAEEKAWRDLDAIQSFEQALINAGVLTAAEISQHEEKMNAIVHQETLKAAHAADPAPEQIYHGLYATTAADVVADEWKTTTFLKPIRQIKRTQEGKILYRHAVWEALAEEMARDRRVVVYGEDIADYGGAFGVTMALMDIYGRSRVFNAPISEAAIVGTACGAAMTGLRPVAEIMYIDFIPLALDQLGNQVAKARYMFGGKAKIPMVLRTTIGGGKGYAGQHSQSLEAIIAHFPGLKVVAPATAYDVKGLLKSAIRDDNPVVFIEHQLLYGDLGEVPEGEYLLPIGKANVVRPGQDLTLVSYSNLLKNTLLAAEALQQQAGINAEVIDLRTLVPLDIETVLKSVYKTGRCAVVIQAPQTCSFAEHVAFEVQRQAFAALKLPVEIICARAVPPPMAAPLEMDNIPSVKRITETVLTLLQKK